MIGRTISLNGRTRTIVGVMPRGIKHPYQSDLWVPLGRGKDENKINTAHFFGELEKAGSGPDAARRTVSYNFGVPINYYARVDFHGLYAGISRGS